ARDAYGEDEVRAREQLDRLPERVTQEPGRRRRRVRHGVIGERLGPAQGSRQPARHPPPAPPPPRAAAGACPCCAAPGPPPCPPAVRGTQSPPRADPSTGGRRSWT